MKRTDYLTGCRSNILCLAYMKKFKASR